MELNLGCKFAFGTYYILAGLGGLFGNISVIIAIAIKRDNRKAQANVNLLTLAIADLVTSVIVVPYFMLGLDLPDYEISQEEMYRLPCRFASFFIYSCGGQRILSLTVMSTDRYFAILHPFFYERYFHRRNLILLNLYSTAQTVLFNLPMLVVPGWVGYDGKPGAVCGFVWKGKLAFLIPYLLLNFILPFVTLIVTNAMVFVTANRQKKRILKEQSRRSDLQQDNSRTRDSSVTSTPKLSNKRLHRHNFNVGKSHHWPKKSLVFPVQPRNSNQGECSDSSFDNNSSVGNGIVPILECKTMENCLKQDKSIKASPKKNPIKIKVGCSLSNSDSTIRNDGTQIAHQENSKQDSGLAAQETRQKRYQEITTALSTLILVLVFVISWLPFAMSRLLFVIDRSLFSWTVVAITSSLTLTSAVLNPFIVIRTRKDLRRTIKEKLRSLFC